MKTLKKKELRRDAPPADSKQVSMPGAKGSTGEAMPPDSGPAPPGGAQVEAAGQEMPAGESSAKGRLGKLLSGLRSRKALYFGIPVLGLALIVSGLLLFKPGFLQKILGRDHQELQPVISLTRPIPIPDYREMLDFLVMTEADRQKTITSFRIEVLFNSPSRYQNFKDQKVVFRDTVFAFLQAQNASRNTTRSWQSVVEKDLFEYINVKLPSSRADMIKLTQVENL